MVKKYFGWGLLAGLLLTFGLKLAVLARLGDHPLLHPDAGLDTTAYAQLAARVLGGDLALGPGLYFVSPLYIYVLAGALAVTDSYTAVRVLQLLLGTIAVGLIALTAREWFGPRAAVAAGALAALTGLFTFYEALILQASIDAVLTSAALYALTRGLKTATQEHKTTQATKEHKRTQMGADRGAGWWIASGVVFGIASLNRPNMLLAAGGVAAALAAREWLARGKRGAVRRVRPAALLAAGVLLGLAPVAIRNVVVSGQWSLVSSHGGLNFLIGNGEGATGFYRNIPGITPTIDGQERDARRVAVQALGRPLTDAEVSGYFYDRAWSWIRVHPWDAAALFARKLAYVFSAAHVALPHSYPFYAYDERTLLRFLVVGPWLLVPLGLTGLVFAAPRTAREDYLVWAAFVPAYAASVAVFFIAERYRLPLLVPLCVGAGAAVAAVAQPFRAANVGRPEGLRRLVLPVAVCVVLFVAVNWPLGLHDGRWEEGLRTAQRLAILGRYDEADAYVARFEPRAPRPGATHHGLGAQLMLLDQPQRALPHLERAHELDPSSAEAADALGQALLKLGRRAALAHAPETAEPYFKRAVELQPRAAAARVQYGLNLVVLRRFAEGARELGEAIRLDPRDPDALAHLAYCELQLGRPAEARAHVAAALAVDPQHPLARQLADVLTRS